MKKEEISTNSLAHSKCVDTAGRNKKVIAEYIRNQLEEDFAAEQMSIKEYIDPFRGDKRKRAKKAAARERLPEMVMCCQTFEVLFMDLDSRRAL